jgi:hypothetical protein
MKWISVALALTGLCAGGLAAWYWYCTGKVSTAPMWVRVENPFEPVIREQAHDVNRRRWVTPHPSPHFSP